MSIAAADKATTMSANNVIIAENEQKVYEAGQKSEYDRFWDEHQMKGERNIYAGAFAGWKGENFKPKYKIAPKGSTVAHYMFYAFNRDNNSQLFDMSPYNDMLDFSGITNQTNMFVDAFIQNLYCDFSNCTNLAYAFQSVNSSRLENLILKVTSKTTNYTSIFNNQTYISKLFFTEDSEITASISFAHSHKLTYESLRSIINALGTVSSTKTLTLHADAKAKLSDSDKAEITQRGWTLA